MEQVDPRVMEAVEYLNRTESVIVSTSFLRDILVQLGMLGLYLSTQSDNVSMTIVEMPIDRIVHELLQCKKAEEDLLGGSK